MSVKNSNFEDFGYVESKVGCKTYYARKKGKIHLQNGSSCQDYSLIKNIDDDLLVIAVADGHGGDAYVNSDIGSRLACEILYDTVKEISLDNTIVDKNDSWLDIFKTSEFKERYIQSWKNAVIKHYTENSNDKIASKWSIIRQYGTTILFAIIANKRVVLGQLGDGAIIMFNKGKQCQLFKRHLIKTSSHTSSLASSKAKYALLIDIFSRDSYANILISTDGIYDKLDTDDSFLIYANSLLSQINNNQSLDRPFEVENIDVSEISRDDCTITLMVSNFPTNKHELILPKEYEQIEFLRSFDEIDIYKAKKGEDILELHVMDDVNDSDVSLKSCTVLQPVETIKLPCEKTLFAYEIPQNVVCLQELIEYGEYLEKKYWFNEKNHSLPEDDDCPNDDIYSNEYWLKIYEKMLLIENEFEISRVLPRRFLFNTAYIANNSEFVFFADSLTQESYQKDAMQIKFNEFYGYFSILGKLCCGKIVIPLFRCIAQGQNISLFHNFDNNKPLCKVIYNEEKKIYGLWNASDTIWNIDGEKKKEVLPQEVLLLNRNHVFSMEDADKDTVFSEEIADDFPQIQIIVF